MSNGQLCNVEVGCVTSDTHHGDSAHNRDVAHDSPCLRFLRCCRKGARSGSSHGGTFPMIGVGEVTALSAALPHPALGRGRGPTPRRPSTSLPNRRLLLGALTRAFPGVVRQGFSLYLASS